MKLGRNDPRPCGIGQFDGAAASYHKVVEIDPDDAGAHNNLGIILRNIGLFDDAVASSPTNIGTGFIR